ncbi:nucleotide exchange factor GrpE [Marinoscillum furvescens]|uniref:Protein GrpE n=1 Tax=Marinoscillum furvescens DSM 4134 TaxID=1122208 RepID=A0A3D9L4C9_MARFU|nr:nucleotide exchange factor GrpE [Marinoscillum furvescens]RED99787.1 molecular chaperone GrpE [Marinoscillum furvescens DSM 4134]
MQKEKDQVQDQVEEKEQNAEAVESENQTEAQEEAEMSVAEDAADEEVSEVEKLQADVSEAKDKYLRLYSEFENFRRRTAKEKIDLIGSANKELVENLVPVLDDFERALKSMEENDEMKPAKEGTELIYNKFKKVLEAKGLKKMEIAKGDDFNDDYHEAITQIPAEEELAGKIVDVVENGYFLNEKVVRFAKVVTGAKS